MKAVAAAAGIVVALAVAGLGVRSCERRVTPVTGLPPGMSYVMRCREDGHEFTMSPAELNRAFEAGEVRGSGDGVDLFRCPKCGRFSAMQFVKEEGAKE